MSIELFNLLEGLFGEKKNKEDYTRWVIYLVLIVFMIACVAGALLLGNR